MRLKNAIVRDVFRRKFKGRDGKEYEGVTMIVNKDHDGRCEDTFYVRLLPSVLAKLKKAHVRLKPCDVVNMTLAFDVDFHLGKNNTTRHTNDIYACTVKLAAS